MDFDKELHEIEDYLLSLDKIEKDNDWLPSPHEIKLYIDRLESIEYNSLLSKVQSEKRLNLEDRLYVHHSNAYEQ